jgi:hypothetical protein
MPPSEQGTRLENFYRSIYPVWAPLLQSWLGNAEDPRTEERMSQVIEQAIWKSGHKVDRNFLTAKQSEIEQRKTAAGAKFREVMGHG